MAIKRFDKAHINKFFRTDEGFLQGTVTLARSGVFPYLKADGSIQYEAKLPEDLLSEETVSSTHNRPVTDGHPTIGLVDSTNFNNYLKGVVSSPRVEGDEIQSDITIYDADLAKEVESKSKYQASIGFTLRLDEQPGEFNGKPYDVIQRDIVINHVALVDRGRAGDTVSFHLDQSDDSTAIEVSEKNYGGNMSNTTVTFRADDGKDYQIPSIVHDLIKQLRKDAEPVQNGGGDPQNGGDDPVQNGGNEPDEEKQKLAQQLADLKTKISELETLLQAERAVKEQAQEQVKQSEQVAQDKAMEVAQKHLKVYEVAKSVENDAALETPTPELQKKVIKQAGFESKISENTRQDELDVWYDAAAEVLRQRADAQPTQNSSIPDPEKQRQRLDSLFMHDQPKGEK